MITLVLLAFGAGSFVSKVRICIFSICVCGGGGGGGEQKKEEGSLEAFLSNAPYSQNRESLEV